MPVNGLTTGPGLRVGVTALLGAALGEAEVSGTVVVALERGLP